MPEQHARRHRPRRWSPRAPNSTSATPRSRSSGVRQAWPAASGEPTTASTSRCAFCTASVMLRIGAPSASMTWISTAEPLGMEPLRIGDAVRAVERVVRRLGVEHHAPVGLDHVARRRPAGARCRPASIRRPPMSISTCAICAGEARARTADPHAGDAGAGHLLGPLDRIAHRIGRGRHVGDVAALDPLAGAVARAEHDHLAVLGQPGDHRRDAERADVDRAEHRRCAAMPGRGPVMRLEAIVSSSLGLLAAAALALAAALAAAALAIASAWPGTRR